MSTHTAPALPITLERFLADSHAAKYSDVSRNHPEAFSRVLAILNEPDQQAELLSAERFGRPALVGVVGVIEADEWIAASLVSPASTRFRQAVGVAVRVTMEAMGWSKTGSQGPVTGAQYFKRAERYDPPSVASLAAGSSERARGALHAITRIGDEEERGRTATEVMRALAATRGAENRPF